MIGEYEDFCYSTTKQNGNNKIVKFYDFLLSDTKKQVPFVKKKEYYLNDFLNSENDKPAVMYFFNHKDISTEVWYKDGVIHRDGDKPAKIKYFGDKTINSYSFYKDGILDRDKGPALVNYYANGNVECRKYY